MRSPALILALTFANLASAQLLTIPDTQNTFDSGTSTGPWPTTAGLRQYIYDTTHFTNAGVTGPITINRLRFRGADGVRNLGGNSYTGVTVQLGTAAVDYLAMSTTYATNRGVMGPLSAAMTVTTLPIAGTWTNDSYIDIDLAANGAAFTYDPTLGVDLLVEVTNPTAPVPSTNMAAVACASTTANGRAQRCAGTIAGPGTLSGFAPVILMDFAGPGGYTAPQGSWVENRGAGCGQQAQSFYQFTNFIGDAFGLRGGKSLLLTPDSPTTPSFYTVTGGTVSPDLSATALGAAPVSVADDAVVTVTPGFTFNFPGLGGSTTTLTACTNGWVGLGTFAVVGGLSPTLAEFRNTPARVAVAWKDQHAGRNVTTHPTSGLYVNTDLSGGPGNGVTYVTWKETGEFTSAQPACCINTYQAAFFESGRIELRYGAINGLRGSSVLTGYSRGGTASVLAVDPGNRDLEVDNTFSTQPEGTAGALTLAPSSRPVLGTPNSFTLNHTLSNIPATTIMSFIVWDFSVFGPSLPLPFGNPGCLQTIVSPAVLGANFVTPPTASWVTTPGNGSLVLPLGTSPNAGAWMGAVLYTQGVTFDISGSGFSTYSSNAIKLVLGLL